MGCRNRTHLTNRDVNPQKRSYCIWATWKRLTLRESTRCLSACLWSDGEMRLTSGFRAVQILQELTVAYKESGVGVHFAHLRPAHLALFELVGITDLVSHLHLSSLDVGI